MGTAGSSSASDESFACRGIVASHPSGATPARTTRSSSRRGTGGARRWVVGPVIGSSFGTTPKSLVVVVESNLLSPRAVPWMNEDEERLRSRMAAVNDLFAAVIGVGGVSE